ncbi:MAG: hypothetical protein ACI86X_000271 [Moritella sp.]|jgi:hypothetical protein
MQVNSTVNTAMLGYQRATNNLDDAAHKLTQQTRDLSPLPPSTAGDRPLAETSTLAENHAPTSSTPTAESINTELLGMQTAMYNGLAALQALRTADDMMGTSIDVTI